MGDGRFEERVEYVRVDRVWGCGLKDINEERMWVGIKRGSKYQSKTGEES